MTDQPLRQTDAWASFMQSLGWQTERLNGILVLIRAFPFKLGSFVKILDLNQPLPGALPAEARRHHRAWTVHIQTVFEQGTSAAKQAGQDYQKLGFKPASPLTPSKTIVIDLAKAEPEVFSTLTPAAQRAIRRAQKLGLKVEKTNEIKPFARLWQAQMRRKGDWLAGTKEITALWNAFAGKAFLLVTPFQDPAAKNAINAGVLLIQNGSTLHYMYAASTPEANHQRAPSLLVWEALKLGQKLGCTTFDFEGVYDNRFPKQQKSWPGFTKFKQGFGGKPVSYLSPYRQTVFLTKLFK